MTDERSRIPRFYKLSVEERVRAVHERGLITRSDFRALATGQHTLDLHAADKMIENVVGVMGLPIGLALNFSINAKDYVIPLVVEEPSIVAALSSAAKLARECGGFSTSSTDPILIGQIQVVNIPDLEKARLALNARKKEILSLANSFHPKMVARGGGARDLELCVHPLPSLGQQTLVVHLLVDTRDAMGANLVNGMCEGVAPLIETITGGEVFLRILSNLTDRALARAEMRIPVDKLAGRGYAGEQVRDGIIIAADLAVVDPYRAATHNKGIMNGIDPLAIATGNDWRAIEAGAHAYAARSGRYSSLTRWWADDTGALCGSIEIPIKVGIVGGPLESNPTVALNLRMLGVESACELAEVMGAVGLAQNFAALRALATDGIQKGHMTLHARSVVTAAGAPAEVFDDVLERVIQSGEIKVWKAQEILAEVAATGAGAADSEASETLKEAMGVGFGKVVLLGEHSVVYGRHALAAPIPLAVRALVEDCDSDSGVTLMIPRWGVEYQLAKRPEQRRSFEKPAGVIFDQLGLAGRGMRIEVFPEVPRSMGLGGSAAIAVAIIRALDKHFGLGLSDQQVNDLAFQSEKVAHGNPSGLDNTVACYGQPVIFRPGDPPLVEPLNIQEPIPIVVGITGREGLTATTVQRVRKAWEKDRKLYEGIFDEIDGLVLKALQAIRDHDLVRLGELMNVNHGLLNALQVSTPELEQLVTLARDNGALGAKLTGGGGGGSIIAVCESDTQPVVDALKRAGFDAFGLHLGAPVDGAA
jgi:hydroxymethylglutaryl-CoA reductase